jgi:hypothetical protein
MQPSIKLIFIFPALLLFACGSNRKSSGFVCKDCSPASAEYKNELARLLQTDAQRLTYIFNKYVESDGHEYLDIEFKGDDFEASGLVLVTNWNKLTGIKRTKGLGYSGAELKGLQLDIQKNPSGAAFVFKDLEEIID